MPLDIESNIDVAEVKVEFSRTIELICALRYLASRPGSGFADKEAGALYSSLCKKSKETLEVVSRSRLKGLELQEFVLREKIFDNIDLLLKKIKGYDRANFIYTFMGEELPLDLIQELCEDNKALRRFLSGKEKSLGNSIELLERLFYDTETLRNDMLGLLKDLDCNQFDSLIKAQSGYYGRLEEEVRGALQGKNYLDFSQEFYGKKFLRIYDFKDYLFVPSYFLRPNKMRFFNFSTQIIIYSADDESLKKQEMGDKISNVLKVVSDRTRLEIMRELSYGPGYGKTLAEKLGLTGSTISHHLDQLKETGLVTEERIKNIKYFTVNQRELEKALAELNEYLAGK